MNKEIFDVLIIGSGPIGLATAIEAKKNDLTHLIIEKGCLVNSIYNYPTNMVFFSTSEKLEIGDVPFISHGIKPTRTEALEYYRRVKNSWGLNVNTYENVISYSGEKNCFKVTTDKDIYECKNIVVAIGFYDHVNYMNVEGEKLAKVKHYYIDPHPYAEKKIVVIGGGNSAVDVALETYRRDAEVTLVLNKEKLEDNVKYWVKPDIENRINEGAIKCYQNSKVIKITETEVEIETPEGNVTVENDFVMAMTGYHPDYNFLKTFGVTFNSDISKIPVYNEETFETETDGIFLAGVVCGGMKTGRWFIENARYHSENIIRHILNIKGA